MKKIKSIDSTVIDILKNGGIGVLPTDTLYGIVGKAENKETVERIYEIRKREKEKPMIVLISSLGELKRFNIELNSKQEKFLKKIWPEKISVVLDCLNEKMKHLHRGKKTIAFRFPKEKWLLDVLKKTGPLVAPSANLAGEKPACDILEAKKYFGEKIEFYVDGGKIKSKPSTIVRLFKNGEFEILRQGDIKIKI